MPDNLRRDQGRDSRGRWKKGVSGCPSGPPTGSRHRTTRLLEQLLDGQAEALVNKTVELALSGDVAALKICLDRLVPPRRDRPVTVKLPPLEGPADLPAMTAALLKAVADGAVTPDEASAIARLAEAHRRALELGDLERRLAALEALQDGNP